MKPFNILEREQKVHCNAMLEASAGTGKTFAIENIVVRLLIDSDHGREPLSIEKILIVTFTRAATRDLKVRIRANLEKALNYLKGFLSGDARLEDCPDYLLAYREEGREAVIQARRRIERALFTFDQAQIYTIHGFCWRMLRCFALEGGVSLESSCSEEETLPKTKLLQVVKDFFRTELISEVYSPQQIKIVLNHFKGKLEDLQAELLKVISKGLDISASPTFTEYFLKFQKAMHQLKQDSAYESEKIISDFLLHAPAYKGLSNRGKQIHPEVMDKVQRFSDLFNKDEWNVDDFDLFLSDGLFLVEALSQDKLMAKGVPPARDKLHYPDLLEKIQGFLGDIVDDARNASFIFARMASDCQTLLRHYQNQEEMLGFNDLLQQMRLALENSQFAARVRETFDAVVVDEFQDTDPVQWDIFRVLFADEKALWEGLFILVGDPKQSIYAFRQADIYTYLSAANILGKEAVATLDTNFRSQPSLVSSLNHLFDSVPDLFPLPRHEMRLSFSTVKAGKKENKDFSDGKASVQFMLAKGAKKTSLQEYQENYFFPAIAKEIDQLNQQDGIRFNQCAVLVSDRFQAEKLMQYLKAVGIPVMSQRGVNLADSIAVRAMGELLTGILHFRHPSSLRVALGGKIIGMTHADIASLQDSNRWESILSKCEKLRRVLITEGFEVFYPQMMLSCWHADGKTVFQRLLLQDSGGEFYREWQDIADLLMQEQSTRNISAEELIAFLDEFEILALNDDERMKVTLDHNEDKVLILTSHVSKGLEFDIVFTLGLIKRPSQKELLIPVPKDGNICLEAIKNHDHPLYKKHCEELDAEKMRQLYVAFTRAKYRLYIPVAMACGGQDVEYGAASPMDLFLAKLGEDKLNDGKTNYDELYDTIKTYDGSSLVNFIEKSSVDIGLTLLEECQSVRDVPIHKASSTLCLLPPHEVTIPGSAVFVQSFTSLAQINSSRMPGEEGDLLAPHDFNNEQKSLHTLPAGSETGTILHTLFEVMPFQTAQNGAGSSVLMPCVHSVLQGTPFDGWQEVVSEMAHKALTTLLPGNQKSFRLADINPKKMYRETEFLFRTDSLQRPGFIKGVIDLFFEHEGKFYFLDWKTNWLGPTLEHYSKKNLEQAMHEHDYGLQAKIYSEALKRYLKIFDKRTFEEVFGGFYYLFLRGVGPETGIWHQY